MQSLRPDAIAIAIPVLTTRIELVTDSPAVDPAREALSKMQLSIELPSSKSAKAPAAGSNVYRVRVMIDKFVMLDFLAAREDSQPGSYPSGNDLFATAAHLEEQPSLVRNNVTNALADLRRLGWIDWVFQPWPNSQAEPRADLIGEREIQQTSRIAISSKGHEALAERRRSKANLQINFIDSTVGQLAFGDITNVDLFTIIAGAERELETSSVPEEEKSKVRAILHELRDTGKALAVGASGELLATLIRRAVGLG